MDVVGGNMNLERVSLGEIRDSDARIQGNIDKPQPRAQYKGSGTVNALPNPFRGSTELSFDLPRTGRIRAVVPDAQGRIIVTLVEGVLEAGRHVRHWNGADRARRHVEPGLYFFRLEANMDGETRMASTKLVLLR